jgi:peptidoglycan/LPS O-acetylase OafA/YrhL
MDLIILVLGIALIGLAVWAITTYVPMEPIFKTIIYIVAAVALVLWLVRQFGKNIPNVMN